MSQKKHGDGSTVKKLGEPLIAKKSLLATVYINSKSHTQICISQGEDRSFGTYVTDGIS